MCAWYNPLQAFVKVINEGGVPSLSSTWQAVIAAEDRRAMWVVVEMLVCGYVWVYMYFSACVCVWQAVIAAKDRRTMWVVVNMLVCGYVWVYMCFSVCVCVAGCDRSRG